MSDPLDALHDTNARRRIHRLYSAMNTPPERKLRGLLPLSTDGPAPPRVHHVHRGFSRGHEHANTIAPPSARPTTLPRVPAAAHHREVAVTYDGWLASCPLGPRGAFARPPPTPPGTTGGQHLMYMATMIKRGKGSDDPMVGTMGGNEYPG